MDDSRRMLNEFNRIYRKQDDLYHEYASHFGLSDIAFWILYVLCETNDIYTQNQIADIWHFPRQSINSSVSALIKQGYVSLEKLSTGNSKAIRLTEEGKKFCSNVIKRFFELEEKALQKMTDEERNMFLELSAKQCGFLEEEIKAVLSSEDKL